MILNYLVTKFCNLRINILHNYRTKWKRSTSLGLELLSERLNYSALHGIRHVGSIGNGLFGSAHFMNNGFNRSILPSSSLQPLSHPGMALYNATNSLRPYQSNTSPINPFQHLTSDFRLLAATGSSAANDAAAIAMQAAAAQAASYQNSLKTAAHLAQEMRATRLESSEASRASPISLASSLSQHYGNLDRLSTLTGLSPALTSTNSTSVKSKISPT